MNALAGLPSLHRFLLLEIPLQVHLLEESFVLLRDSGTNQGRRHITVGGGMMGPSYDPAMNILALGLQRW
jgi:hypothetical protein